MEKDILIQNLRTRVGEDNCKSISDKTFEGIANVYLPLFTDDTKITEETWKFPVAALTEYAGQKRHDDAVFTEKFKADYAKEYATQHEKDVEERIRVATEKALEDYKKDHPETGGDGNKGGGGGEDTQAKIDEAVAKAMEKLTGKDSELAKSLATISSFVTNQTEREKTETKNRVRAELKQHLVNLKANNEACIDDALDDIDYGDNPTFEGLKQSVISAYEKRYHRYYADGGKPFGGDSTGGNSGGSSFVKDRIDRLKKEAAANAEYAAEVEKTFS
ncbi:MAG: hypothetical protein IJV13_08770 [Prevotella sp.]|nr:hypothetical protein [Prevotella sp.]